MRGGPAVAREEKCFSPKARDRPAVEHAIIVFKDKVRNMILLLSLGSCASQDQKGRTNMVVFSSIFPAKLNRSSKVKNLHADTASPAPNQSSVAEPYPFQDLINLIVA